MATKEALVDFSRLSVLVVDDNIYMRVLIRDLLKSFGTGNVLEAIDGADGIQKLKENWVDIVFVDWMMEPLDGLDFVKLIRKDSNLHQQTVPIIMLSGHTEKKRVKTARDIGVNEFLAKPVASGALYDRIVYIIQNPRAFVKTDSYIGPDRRRKNDPNYSGSERRGGAAGASILSQDEISALMED